MFLSDLHTHTYNPNWKKRTHKSQSRIIYKTYFELKNSKEKKMILSDKIILQFWRIHVPTTVGSITVVCGPLFSSILIWFRHFFLLKQNILRLHRLAFIWEDIYFLCLFSMIRYILWGKIFLMVLKVILTGYRVKQRQRFGIILKGRWTW